MSYEDTQAAKIRGMLENACRLLKSCGVAQKTPLFASRPQVTESQLFDEAALSKARQTAEKVDALGAKIADFSAEQAKLSSQIAALSPWRGLDLPLNFTGTRETEFFTGTLPSAIETDSLSARTAAAAPACMLEIIASDAEQHYLAVTVYIEQQEAALGVLKSCGFVAVNFKDISLTAHEHIEQLEGEIAKLEKEKELCLGQIESHYDRLPALLSALDAYTQEAARDELLSITAKTEHIAYFTGWLPAAAKAAVEALLAEQGCAYLVDEPNGETPPVLMQNSGLIAPVESVTEMYDTPSYDSVVDPNPFMFPFYIAFFGLIMADMAYGLLMFFGCRFALKAMKPKGTTEKTLKLFMYCGVTTFFAGMLFGGFFADSVAVFTQTFFGKAVVIPPLWFDPSSDPMKMLAFSATLGGLHILLGMALAAYRMIRQGHILDAVFDVGSWYVIFIGIGLFVMKADIGKYIIIAGALLLVVTGGRNSPTILGKITGGLGSLYGITGYLSDVLSYARIMALGLSGAMVGQVMNQLGTMAGGGFFGLLIFVAVFVAGHTFNLAIGLLGAYVHTGRLQYIEFFGKFFEGGGRAFRPLVNNTNYVTIIKED